MGIMGGGACIFCKIIAKEVPAEIYYEDTDVVVFEDIKPVAKFHLLAVPKTHIENVNNLTSFEDKMLIEKLIECGNKILKEKHADLENIRSGFHLPPFNSVGHLHLHLISPTSDMSYLHRLSFRPNSWWFASVEQILQKIENNNKQD